MSNMAKFSKAGKRKGIGTKPVPFLLPVGGNGKEVKGYEQTTGSAYGCPGKGDPEEA